jgi:hypothetical protein
LLRAVAFGLMVPGLALALGGLGVEGGAFRAAPTPFDGGPTDGDRDRERQRAHALKATGLGLVIAGPTVWLLGSLWLRRRLAAEPGGAPDTGRDSC